LSHINNNNKNTVKEIILYCAFCEVKTDLNMNLLNFIVVTNRIVSIYQIAILFSKSCLGHPLGYWAGSNNLGHSSSGFISSVCGRCNCSGLWSSGCWECVNQENIL